MLKNKIIVKKIRNIFILLMAIIIMFGVYTNIRNSRAENVIQIEMEIADKSNVLENQTVTVDATETKDGNYLLDLPTSVNGNIVTKYYTTDGAEVEMGVENTDSKLELTEIEIANKKVQLHTDYDTKEVVIDNETKTFYNKELKNNEDGDVVVTGYMPLNAELEVNDIDLATLTNVKVPSEKQTIQKAYEISVFEMVEKQVTTDEEETTVEESTTETQTETNNENIETEKQEYDPSAYGEVLTVKNKNTQSDVMLAMYSLTDNNQITAIESMEDGEYVNFETDKNLKYIIATEPKEIMSDDISSDDATADGSSNVATQATSGSNVLKSTKSESSETSSFLGTTMLRNQINRVVFRSYIGRGYNEWDVSESGDGSIIAWTINSSAPYDVFIGSSNTIYANPDSSYLFAYIGTGSSCTNPYTITGLENLNTSKVTNMDSMFKNCGNNAMTDLDLGDNFDTSNVTSMREMFHSCGSNAMVNLNLGKNFNTKNVTDMTYMFNDCGYNAMTSLALGNLFDTSNVTSMYAMFDNCGGQSMTSLDLGPKFKKIVTGSMIYFSTCGKQGQNVIYVSEDIYSDTTHLKMDANSTSTISYTRGTVNLKYRNKSYLKSTSSETSGTSGFLGNTNIQRQNIGEVTITNFLDDSSKMRADGSWDVSEAHDGSIMAYYFNNSYINVYIVGDNIYANPDSSYLFAYIGYKGSSNDGNNIIQGLDNLNTSEVTNMSSMFYNYGYNGATILDLGENFDTRNVIDMNAMFAKCGYEKMQYLNLGDKFDTSNVTDMESMFNGTGFMAMTELDLGENFDTKNVSKMTTMFSYCGYNAMTSLNLGKNFDTKNVSMMGQMFSYCGYTSMTSLDLGPAFIKIADISREFIYNCGKSGQTVINVPESIYSDENNLKLGTSSTTTISYTRGTINLKYKPEWKKINTKDVTDGTKSITIGGAGQASVYTNTTTSTLTASQIKVLVDGNESTSIGKQLSTQTSWKTTSGTNTATGVQYTVTLSNLPTEVEEVKIQIPEGTLTDQYGNKNKTTEIKVYGYTKLKATNTETSQTSGFLGNTSIQRQNIENITFMSSIPSTVYDIATNEIKNANAWDVSEAGDNSIIAWYETQSSGALKVYIGSNYLIRANENSSYLFSYIGYASVCTATETITNLDLLYTNKVTNMSYMFRACGYQKMESLVLGVNFDTSNVTNMYYMFERCGRASMKNLNLGINFNTKNVTSMNSMFEYCGQQKMTDLNLGDNFDTSNVEDMGYMFYYCGYTEMKSLSLGEKFNTNKTKTMNRMFYYCGSTAMTNLDLGPAFTKIANTNTYFLSNCGKSGQTVINVPESIYKSATSLRLGSSSTTTISYTRGTINPKYKPEWTKISSTVDETSGTVTIKVGGIGRASVYTNTTTSTLTASKVKVLIDGEEATGVTKNLSSQSEWKTTSGTNTATGVQYTITLSNFEESVIQSGKSFKEWSGNISLEFDAGTLTDNYGNKNVKDTIRDSSMFVDFIAPDIVYRYSSADIDKDGKTVQVAFDVTDKYYASGELKIDDLTVKIDGEVPDWTKVTKALRNTDITENGKTYGKHYVLTLSGLEQSQIADGEKYLNYSGVVTVAVAGGKITDTSGNKNLPKTITMGISLPEETGSAVVADVVNPIWEKVSSTVDLKAKTATIVINGTDKYFASSTLTTNNVKILVNGVEQTSGITKTLSSPTSLKETRVVNGTSKEVQYGVQYTITVSNYPIDKEQVKVQIPEGMLTDESGNKNKVTDFVIYSSLRETNTETSERSSFLGNSNIQRQQIDKLIFQDNADGANDTKWDVSAQNDGSIIAWYERTLHNTYVVYIGSPDGGKICANSDSSYLFAYLGYSSNCTITETISGLSNFNTITANNMSDMFYYTGYMTMTSLDLGENFDTSNVTNMSGMFVTCGTEKLQYLDLGDRFDTSNVTDMAHMFKFTGTKALEKLNLGDKFNTSNVTDMTEMFMECGRIMTSLDLGDKFDTSNVNYMYRMFSSCGLEMMTELDLGPAFTKIAEKNANMFTNTGKDGEITIYAPESIYSDRTDFKLNTNSTTTDEFSRGTINPKYRTEWQKEETKVTVDKTDISKSKIEITLRGTTNTEVSADEYISNVVSTLTSSDIKVYIDGTDITNQVTIQAGTGTETNNTRTGAKDVLQKITLTNFEESTRKNGKNFTEWSGNISIQPAKGKLKDSTYGNGNLAQIDTTGEWEDIVVKDTDGTDHNETNAMFADFIKPEITYEYANTTIDHGNKTVKVVFDVTDKYYNNTTLTQSDIKVSAGGVVATNATKELAKKQIQADQKVGNITYKANGDIYYTINGTSTKVGERYELVITNLDQGDADKYSGVMTLEIPKDKITDKSGNTNISKTITIGIDDPSTGDGHDSEVIVDVVDPIWKTQNVKIDKANKKATVELVAVDKYLSGTANSTLTEDQITVSVDGDENANTKIKKQLSKPEYSTNQTTGLKEIKYTLTLTNWEESSKQTGKDYFEYSGTTKIKIAEGTITDDNTNKSKEKEFTLGNIDVIKPKIEKVSSSPNRANKTETIIFNVIDKYLDTSKQMTADDITVYVDGEEANTVTKTLTRVTANDVSETINGKSQVVSQQYQLVISNFEEERTEIVRNREYLDWSGTVSIDIAESSIKDTSGNTIDENTTTVDGNFVDFINPNVTYEYVEGDIDYTGKTFTMAFDITDKYFASSLLATEYANAKTEAEKLAVIQSYLTIKVDGEDITNKSSVKKEIIAIEDIKAGTTSTPLYKTINGNVEMLDGTDSSLEQYRTIGKRYTLKISNLEQNAITSHEYLDYSGVITVAVKTGTARDYGEGGAYATVIQNKPVNANIATTITSGVNIPGGVSPDDEKIVDVVDPIWQKVATSSADPVKRTANIVIRGTDKYLESCSLTSDKIRIFVDDVEQKDGITVELTKDTSVVLAYGVQYNVKITGFVSNAYQVKMVIPAGTLTDESGNTNKETEFVLYSCLRKTDTETEATSPFLGNADVQRQKVEKIILQDNLDGVNDTRWDVSAQEDGSIIAWYETTSRGTYIVHIGSYLGINANKNSTNLFRNIGRSSACAETDETSNPIIENIELLNVQTVENMSYMFSEFGYSSMKTFDLGTNFDTSNVTDMRGMFNYTGAMAMTNLNLGNNFDTSNVTNMEGMFNYTGVMAMTSLNLENKFDTSNVTSMSFMFEQTGANAMTSLNLGNKFNTSNVTNMDGMFINCGFNAMTELDLGDKFYTTQVTNMYDMFGHCGFEAMTELDLGPAFTQIADINGDMFYSTGKDGEITINAPESIYSDKTHFKLDTNSTSTIEYTRGTINPKYRTEWQKEETKVTVDKTDISKSKIEVILRGTTNTEVSTNRYISNVASTLTSSDIKVFIDGTDITNQVTIQAGTGTETDNTRTGAKDVLQKITLTNFEEDTRKNGKNFTEWSGNISIQLAKGKLKDSTYGNGNLERIDTTGEWEDVVVKDTEGTDHNQTNAMFTDFIKPEITYEYANTTIDHGNKTVKVVFDVTDKYYNSTTLTQSDIKVSAGGVVTTNATKELAKKQIQADQKVGNITYKANGDIYYTINGTSTKVGERYELVITNLDQGDADKYSGVMTLEIPKDKITDKSGNTNISKTITIGIDDPSTGDGHDSEVIVDVVDPIWKTQNVKIDKANKKATVELVAVDKYLSGTANSTLTEDQITVSVDGDENANTKIKKQLSKPEYSTNQTTGLKEIKYTLTLTNWEESSKQTGKDYFEYSGTTKIKIAEGTITDDNTNKSKEKEFTLGHVDFIKPKIEKVSSSKNDTDKTETITFNVIDKYLDISKQMTADEITVSVDGEEASTITKTLTRVTANDVSKTINGKSQVVSQQYQLVLSNFEKTRNSKEYKDWSGTVSIDIAENAIKDTSSNTIDENTTTIQGDFVDFINPDLKYVHQSTDINKTGKTYSMTFTVTDKYYTSGKLSINDLTIKMENGQLDQNGNPIVYNLKNEPVTISLQDTELKAKNVAITNTSGNIETVSDLLIGHTYVLKIENLEQLEVKEGFKTADYSGVVTVAVSGNKILDRTNNGNIATTLTSGINIPGGTTPGDAEVVDVVDPIWEKVSSSAYAFNPTDKTKSTAEITFKGTDSYFANSTLTSDKIKVFVDGTEVTSGITKKLSTAKSLEEQRKEFGKTSTITKQYGVEYTLTLEGWSQNAQQVKIQLPEGTIIDESGNKNKQTDLIVFNQLRKTDTETTETSAFLGNTKVQRQNVDNVTFVDNIPSAVYDKTTNQITDSTAWDVSARQDKSIIAWYETETSGALKVYIGSNDEIFANQNSTNLFAYIGKNSKCTSTETITNISLLNVDSVTNMQGMFKSTGYKAMTKLDFGNKFNTSNVTNMKEMFKETGYTAMTTLKLESGFNTINVTDMSNMFEECGRNVMTDLDLGDNFNTINVIYMNGMFKTCGLQSMTGLDLGENFNTINVKYMKEMFYSTGSTAMTTLNLGENFNTSNVLDMSKMFFGTGYDSLTSLDLGDVFYLTSVTDMEDMFNRCGNGSMTELDLGPAFTSIKSPNSVQYFVNMCGKKDEIVIYAPESIYSDKTHFKLDTNSTSTIEFTQGTINPKYRTEWQKEETKVTVDKTDISKSKIEVTLRGTTNTEVQAKEYISNVTSTLTSNDIKVVIDGTDITNQVTIEAGTGTETDNTRTGAKDVLQKVTISNFEETARRDGKSYKEWSGNITIEVAQGTLKDVTYENRNMSLTTERARTDSVVKDTTSVDKNTTNSIFTDFIRPEFTYIYSNGNIDHTNKTLAVEFSVTDKYFNSSTVLNSADNIGITLLDTNTEIPTAKVKKTITKTEDIEEERDGKTVKIGEKYKLVIEGLEQVDENGIGNGETYSGPMSITFPGGIVADKSNNSNITKVITIGVNEPDNTGNQEIVDVVDPVWSVESANVNTGVIKLRVKDKYLAKDSSKFELTKESIRIVVNDVESTAIVKTLNGPTEITANEEYEYTLTLSNIIPSDGGYTEFTPIGDPIVGGTAKYRNENGGNIKLRILAGTVTDQYGNSTKQQDLPVGDIDFSGPEVYYIQKTRSIEDNKETIIFNVTDKNYKSTDLVTTDEMTVWIDGVQVDDQITKNITKTVAIKTTVDGTVRTVGHQYTLELGGIVETETEFLNTDRKYRELSGTLEIKIDKNASKDMRGNPLNEDTTTIIDTTDLIKPEVIYKYATSDIDKTDKTYTMVFDMVDKYYDAKNSTQLKLEDLTIKVDGKVPDWNEVTKKLQVEDVTASVNGENKVIGKEYTLKLSNLEQLQIKEGENYLDYSGVITVAIPADKMVDTTGNTNIDKTITSGVNIPGGTGTGTIVDVVDPLIERKESSANAVEKTATIKFNVTDKYFKASTIAKNNIKVYVNGEESATSSIDTLTSTELKEQVSSGNTTTTVQYGIQYTVTIKGFDTNANQVKLKIPAGLVTDNNGNSNKDTDLIVYNVLKNTSTEKEATNALLGNTKIQRQNVDKLTFVDNIPLSVLDKKTKEYKDSTAWDVSAEQDKSILAWYTTNGNGTLNVYIGSDNEIFANRNSSYLFAYIGRSDNSTSTETIVDIDKLNVNYVTNMQAMFLETGYTAMTTLNLGNNFNTSNVTNMDSMFKSTGYMVMTGLDLGSNFNTSAVTIMNNMFNRTGRQSLSVLNLENKFYTNEVTEMYGMFLETGYTAMTELSLGNNFNTLKVTDMSWMFSGCGYTSMTKLNIGNEFDTRNVEKMHGMFNCTGKMKMTSLDLGDKFYTTKATDMIEMFNKTGNDLMTSLDLGPAFTKIVETNTDMFTNTGKDGEITINATESIYQNKNNFKLNTEATSSAIEYTRGTINPKYRTEWQKEGTKVTIDKTDISKSKIEVTLRGTTNTEVPAKEYISNVTSTLTVSGIKVYIDGNDITNQVTKQIETATETDNTRTGAKDVLQKITISNFEETARREGKSYKEWSGNITIEVAQGTLKDVTYENRNMSLTTERARTDSVVKDTTSVDKNTTNSIFTDFIRPEFTYIYSNGNIDHTNKTLAVEFSVTDKYFNSSTVLNSADNIGITLLDTNTEIPTAKVKKTITKTEDIEEERDGKTVKIGEKYKLVIEGLEQVDENGIGNGETYSGPMSITFPGGIVADKSNNSNITKVITIGVNEPDNTGNQEIVDVVDPVWSVIDTNVDTGVIKLRVKDKYLIKDSSKFELTKDKIKIVVNDVESTAIVKTLNGPEEIVPNEEYEYTLTLTNITPPGEGYTEFTPIGDPIVGGTAKYKNENGGNIKLRILAGTVTDKYGNSTKQQDLPVGDIDYTSPEVYYIQKTRSIEDNKETIIFNVTDKNYKSTDLVTTDEMTVWIDGVQVDDQITKDITKTVAIKTLIDGIERTVGHQYTLELSDIVETDTEFLNTDRRYRELSGTLEIKIDENASTDMRGNKLNTDTTTITDTTDLIKPEVIYKYATADIDKTDKTYTMVFDMVDKYYDAKNSTQLKLEDLTIKVDGKVPDWNEVTKKLQVEDITASVNGENKVIGKEYTLKLSNLEQLQIKDGENYLDYSGVITVAIPADKMADTTGNTNTDKTITSGVNIPGGTGTGTVVDVVDPFIERKEASANAVEKTAMIKFNVTDKYFKASTITKNNIKVYVNGEESSTASIDTFTSTELKEQVSSGNTTTTVKYGVQYTVTIKGFDTNVNQVKLKIPAGLVSDNSGNVNKETDLIAYTVLKQTDTETKATSAFLGNTKIQRQNIDSITFENSIPADVGYDETTQAYKNSTTWDVSAEQDKSILAWYTTNGNGTLKVYIGSDDEIFANRNSSYLFAYIGRGDKSTSQETITNINRLNVNYVTNMQAMFFATGYKAMTSLDLGNAFKTDNVTNMDSMFMFTGYEAMTSLKLESNFNTSKVTNMKSMFNSTGYTKMTALDLEDKFNTSIVTDMSSMFNDCGQKAMESLNIREKFDTSSVTDMSNMFNGCGKAEIKQFDLGSKFNTINVRNMSNMFQGFGQSKLTSLDLGDKFNTSNVTDMVKMFNDCGSTLMTVLDLGAEFTTIPEGAIAQKTNTTVDSLGNSTTSIISAHNTYDDMFKNCGITNIIVYAPESIYSSRTAFKTK